MCWFSNKICFNKQSLIASDSCELLTYPAPLSVHWADTFFFKPLSFPCLSAALGIHYP